MTTTTNGTDGMRERMRRLDLDLVAAMKAAVAVAGGGEIDWTISHEILHEIEALQAEINQREFDAYWAGSIGAQNKTPLTSPDQQRA